jgi:hypothetical protein
VARQPLHCYAKLNFSIMGTFNWGIIPVVNINFSRTISLL